MTFAATAEVVRYAGAVPVLVDCEPDTLNLSLEDLERKLEAVTSGALSAIVGRVGQPPNDPEFKKTELEVIEYWSAKSGIPYLGRADIGHDVENKIVPFGGRR